MNYFVMTLCRYVVMSLYRYSDIPLFRYSDIPIFRYSDIPVYLSSAFTWFCRVLTTLSMMATICLSWRVFSASSRVMLMA